MNSRKWAHCDSWFHREEKCHGILVLFWPQGRITVTGNAPVRLYEQHSQCSASDGSCWFLVLSVKFCLYFWWFPLVPGDLWWFLVVSVGFWLFLEVPDGFLVVSVGSWWFLVIYGGYWFPSVLLQGGGGGGSLKNHPSAFFCENNSKDRSKQLLLFNLSNQSLWFHADAEKIWPSLSPWRPMLLPEIPLLLVLSCCCYTQIFLYIIHS